MNEIQSHLALIAFLIGLFVYCFIHITRRAAVDTNPVGYTWLAELAKWFCIAGLLGLIFGK